MNFNRTKIIKVMRVCNGTKGYLQICLTKNNLKKTHKIHRLVAKAFIPNPNPETLTDINHIDENKKNNCVENLEWCTTGYNTLYGSRIAKTSMECGQFDLDGNLIKIWDSISQVKRILGFSPRQIIRCCDGLIKSAYGFTWKRARERGTHLKID